MTRKLDRSMRALVRVVVVWAAVVWTAPAPAAAIAWSDELLATTAPRYVVSLHLRTTAPSPTSQFCTGSLIARRWVLTAGHCFDDTDPTSVSVVVHNATPRQLAIRRVVVHPAYAALPVDVAYLDGSDIALVELRTPVRLRSFPSLPEPDHVVGAGGLRVYGYGRDEHDNERISVGARSMTLDTTGWADLLYDVHPERQLAAYGTRTIRFEAEPDAPVDVSVVDAVVCPGDSGGPLVESIAGRDVLVGVVSYGIACTESGPNVYTRVSAFSDWIDRVIGRSAVSTR